MNNVEIGKFIREIRKEKGFTQKELAEKLGLTDKAISKWERGLSCPDISLLEELSSILDITVIELLKGQRASKERPINDKDLIDTMKYSRKNTIQEVKKVYKLFAYVIVSIIILFILITNIRSILFEFQTIDMHKNDYWTWTENASAKVQGSYENFKKDLSELINDTNDKLDKLSSNQGIYTDDDYNIISRNIKTIKEYLKNGNNEKYLAQDKYSYFELLQFYLDHQDISIGYINYKEIYEVLLKYDNTLGERLLAYSSNENSIKDAYFNIYSYFEQPYTFKTKLPYKNYIPNTLWLMELLYENYNNLLNDILKVGEIK